MVLRRRIAANAHPNAVSVSPAFARGDALIFDELFLHATGGSKPGLSRTRFALEAWLFGASTFPAEYVPMFV